MPLVADAEARAPLEACGLILATEAGLVVAPTANVAPTPATAYAVPAAPLLAAHRAGHRVHAIYHSHPDGPATLSPTDVQALVGPDGPLWPGVEQWVVGLRGGKVVDLARLVWDGRRFEFVVVERSS